VKRVGVVAKTIHHAVDLLNLHTIVLSRMNLHHFFTRLGLMVFLGLIVSLDLHLLAGMEQIHPRQYNRVKILRVTMVQIHPR